MIEKLLLPLTTTFFLNILHSPALIYPVSKGNLPHTWQNLKVGRNGMNSSCGEASLHCPGRKALWERKLKEGLKKGCENFKG